MTPTSSSRSVAPWCCWRACRSSTGRPATARHSRPGSATRCGAGCSGGSTCRHWRSGLALFVPFVFVGQYAKEQGIDCGPGRRARRRARWVERAVTHRLRFARAAGSVRSGSTERASSSTAFSFLIWFVAGSSYALLVLFVLVLGVGYGGFVALSPILISDRMGIAGLGSILGLLYTAPGLGGLIGPPAAGWLIDRTGTYRWAIIACLISSAVSVGAALRTTGRRARSARTGRRRQGLTKPGADDRDDPAARIQQRDPAAEPSCHSSRR